MSRTVYSTDTFTATDATVTTREIHLGSNNRLKLVNVQKASSLTAPVVVTIRLGFRGSAKEGFHLVDQEWIRHAGQLLAWTGDVPLLEDPLLVVAVNNETGSDQGIFVTIITEGK